MRPQGGITPLPSLLPPWQSGPYTYITFLILILNSGTADKIDRLQVLQNKALSNVDNNEHPDLDTRGMSNYYRVTPLKECRAEHLSLIMYSFSKYSRYIEESRPEIHLRNRDKIKFKTHKRVHEKYLKSPLSGGITMWDRIPESDQQSTIFCYTY